MRLLVVMVLAACVAEPTPHPDWTYAQIPAEPQRSGDPAKGYDYLINGGYITCGVPKTAFDQVFGNPPVDDKIDGRTGDNKNLPFYYSAATSSEGVTVISANCLTCHASHLNGEVIVGLGSTEHDFTTDQSQYVDAGLNLVTDPNERAEFQRFSQRVHAIGPYTKTLTVGTNPADNLTAVLMAHRDPQTLAWLDTPALEVPQAEDVAPVDVPPWWRMAKKTTMFYGAAGRGDHARIMMAASLLCTDSVAEAQQIDAAFVDVRAWIETLSAPKWPYAIDGDRAAKGKTVFYANCARCHGTYGDGGLYPNELVPLDDIGTDPLLASGSTQFSDRFVTWFESSFWGETSRLEPQLGYIAPPLDGIWASAPYFHNGSVPTLAAVLDSTTRPVAWKRTFDSSAYDQTAVGWQFVAAPTHAELGDPRTYDTTEPGYSNTGHTFGDALSPNDRDAVIEYLKTL
ncbi:MAG: c-type cytochrome [Kofleriaceae bacterium]